MHLQPSNIQSILTTSTMSMLLNVPSLIDCRGVCGCGCGCALGCVCMLCMHIHVELDVVLL